MKEMFALMVSTKPSTYLEQRYLQCIHIHVTSTSTSELSVRSKDTKRGLSAAETVRACSAMLNTESARNIRNVSWHELHAGHIQTLSQQRDEVVRSKVI